MTYLPSNLLVRFIGLLLPSVYVFLAPYLHVHLPYEPVSTRNLSDRRTALVQIKSKKAITGVHGVAGDIRRYVRI